LACSCLIAVATGPALAQNFYEPDIARSEMGLARVKAGARVYFYRGADVAGCPAPTVRCRLRSYLVARDPVLVGKPNGDLIEAGFTDGAGHVTIGWLPVRSIDRIPIPRAASGSWLGSWSSNEAEIEIAAG
jgi:hypothetical protein